jgi:hypothetical protein
MGEEVGAVLEFIGEYFKKMMIERKFKGDVRDFQGESLTKKMNE